MNEEQTINSVPEQQNKKTELEVDNTTLFELNSPKPLEDMPYIFCSSCGKKIAADSRFCSSCGYQISK